MINELMNWLLGKGSGPKAKGLNVNDFSYHTFQKVVELNGIPPGFIQAEDPVERDRFIELFGQIRQGLYDKHAQTLSEEEQDRLKHGTHPSLSHKSKDEAEQYAANLANDLAHLEYVKDVIVGFYHCDRIVLTIQVKDAPDGEVADRELPYLYKGFETKVMEYVGEANQ